ncbi:MAG: hypothetical protein JRN68_06380 [Nitrososphaerota archaeon]|nr:hypothetical protein [Ferrimicrobium acidiphilum]MDG6934308.1 hypothetical protein [Nitrososphaerota archaeon]
MVVVSGKPGLFREIKETFSLMKRFFAPLEIKLMREDETAEVLEKPLRDLQFRSSGKQ